MQGKLSKEVAPRLRKMLDEQKDVPRRLRALWALHGIGALDEKQLRRLLDDQTAEVRVWAIRLLMEDRGRAVADRLTEMAKKEKSAAVRLALASALQRMVLKDRWELVEALASHGEDAMDANLPLMMWYAVEPLVAADPDRATGLLLKVRVPLLRQYIARRIAAMVGNREELVSEDTPAGRRLRPVFDPLKADVLRRWPGGLIEFYGMTEGGGTTLLAAHEFPDKLHTVRRPMSGHDIRLIDEDGKEVPVGEIGEVVGHSPAMML